MNTLTTTLRKAFDSILSELVAAQHDLFARANTERHEMLALVARMTETRNELRDLNVLYAEFSEELTELAADAVDIADKISDTLENPIDFCPTCNYEDFVGWCDECGAEIACDNAYEYDEATDTLLCSQCMPQTVDLAESVAGA